MTKKREYQDKVTVIYCKILKEPCTAGVLDCRKCLVPKFVKTTFPDSDIEADKAKEAKLEAMVQEQTFGSDEEPYPPDDLCEPCDGHCDAGLPCHEYHGYHP